MRRTIYPVMALCLLTACSSRRPSSDECRMLIDKEIDFAASHVPTEDADRPRTLRAADRAANIRKCATRETRREFVNCMNQAAEPSAIGKCIMDENRRNK